MTYINNNLFLKLIINKKIDNIQHSLEIDQKNNLEIDISVKYPSLDRSQLPQVTDGQDGNGLNLLLIDDIKTEGYVKELLTMYRDAGDGKYSSQRKHAPFASLLSIHFVESGPYPGTNSIIPKSYIPIEKGVPQWKKSYRSAPADSMTLNKLDNTVANLMQIDQTFNGVGSSKYANVFNVDKDYFNNSPISTVDGAGNKGRKIGDKFFIPDSISYLDQQITSVIENFTTEVTEVDVLTGMFSIHHNAGSAYLPMSAGFGLDPTGDKYIKSRKNAKDEYLKFVPTVTEDFLRAVNKYGKEKALAISKDYSIPFAVAMMIDNGYYMTSRAVKVFDGGLQYTSKNKLNRTSQLAKGWNLYYGTNLTHEQVLIELKKKVKDIEEIHPEYNETEVNNIYGTRYKNDLKGAMWRLEDRTSSAYKNKHKGKDPRVLHIINMETAGYLFSVTSTSGIIYKNLLKYAGVNTDPTKPSNVYKGKDSNNTFIPQGGQLSSILSKINAEPLSAKAMEALEKAYSASGFNYVFGGDGEPVDQDTYNRPRYSQGGREHKNNIAEVFRTKDGTDPSVRYNRRKENLVNAGKLMFDCADLIEWALNQTIVAQGKAKKYVLSSTGFYNSSRLRDIKLSEAKAGDVLSKIGHIAWFLSKSNPVTLTASETKAEPVKGVSRSGRYWTLEARKTGTKVGIRTWDFAEKNYKIKRIKDLE